MKRILVSETNYKILQAFFKAYKLSHQQKISEYERGNNDIIMLLKEHFNK